jgi:phospholipase C
MGSIKDIKHVVILMQENRSFDEYFGTFPGATGFDDPNGAFANQFGPDGNGNDIKPFRMSTFTSSGLERDGNSHDWATFNKLFAGAKNGQQNLWNEPQAQSVMGYYAANDIPFHWDLAGAFALCDHYFASALSATAPNRLFLMSGCVEDPRLLNNPNFAPTDPNGVTLWAGPAIGPNVRGGLDDPNSSPSPADPNQPGLYPEGLLSWQSYADLLSAKGITWKVYDETALAATIPSPNPTNGWGTLNILAQFATWAEGANANGSQATFESDANGGTLPSFSFIVQPFWASEWENNHPSDGAAYIAGKLAAILNGIDANGSPLWDSTVFILIYDESGGHFDHVLPPAAPAGASGEYQTTPGTTPVPLDAGFRAPAIIVSPWTFNRGVQHQIFDHTSVLQFLEEVTKNFTPNNSQIWCLPNLPMDSWRRTAAGYFGDLTSVFDFGNPVTAGQVMSAFPWTQPYTYPPTSPTMAQTYAALAFKRLQPFLVDPSSPYGAPVSNPSYPNITTNQAKTNFLAFPDANVFPPTPQSCQVLLPVASYDLAQVNSVAQGGSATFPKALQVILYGFEPNELFNPDALGALSNGIGCLSGGSCTTRVPKIAFSNASISVDLQTVTISQNPALVTTAQGAPLAPGIPYTFTFFYDLIFSNIDQIFPAVPPQGTSEVPNTYVVNASFQVDATFTASAELELVAAPDPQFYKNFTDDTTWLSGELVVFSLPAGTQKFGATLGDPHNPLNATSVDALKFITNVISNLNPPPNVPNPWESDFDALNAEEDVNQLAAFVPPPGVTPTFNFALARVHLSSSTPASNVRVFFRSCRASVTTGAYDATGPNTGPSYAPAFYRSNPATGESPSDTKIPLLGVAEVTDSNGSTALEYVSIPFFATKRVNPNTSSMAGQTDEPNVLSIDAASGNTPSTKYFGCWLDINQSDQLVPNNIPGNPQEWDGPWNTAQSFPQGTLISSICEVFNHDLHECLIAEISFDPITIPQGDVPGYSAWLAQRNLGLLTS